MDYGETSVRVKGKRSSTIRKVFCSHCGLTKDVFVKPGSAIGADYRFFLDLYIADQDLHRLEKRLDHLKKENDKEGLILYYSILRARCKTKASEALKCKGHVNLTLVHLWEYKCIECSRKLESLGGESFSRKLESLGRESFKERRVKVRNDRRDRRDYFLPYPYIFKPPEPPYDIGLGTNVQRYKLRTSEEPEFALFCKYCGSTLDMDERFCSVCGKKS